MKPVFLEFCGINSFSEPASIDFGRLLEFGIFGIFGETGSGKSTVLDCIGFALYGAVSRSRTGSLADVINDRSDRAYVHFEFEIVYDGKRRTYRVERELKRKKDAAPTQNARVYERSGDSLSALADGVRESNALLERIIGLEQRDFEKCIALPQGEFAQFVKSARGDKLKLIARLFELEKYGEALIKRVNANFSAAKAERDVLAARLEPFAGISAEHNKALKARLFELSERQEKAISALQAAREREKALTELYRIAAETKKVASAMEKLEEEREPMRAMRAELERLGQAQNAVAASLELEAAGRRLSRAEQAHADAQMRLKKSEEAFSALPAFDEEGTDRAIAALAAERARAEGANPVRERYARLSEELEKTERAAREVAERIVDPHYAEQRAEIEALLAKPIDKDFFAFLEGEGKKALLRGEYETFANELSRLTQKYPVISPDTQPLIERYAAEAEGERAGIADLKAVFEQRERARNSASETLIRLEKAQKQYELCRQEAERLRGEAVRIGSEAEALSKQLADLPDLAAVERELEQKRREKREYAEKRARLEREKMEAALAAASAEEQLRSARLAEKEASARLLTALGDAFSDVREARLLTEKYGDAEAAKKRVEDFREEYAATRRRLRELLQTDSSAATEENLRVAREELAQAERDQRSLTEQAVLAREELARAERDLEKKRSLEAEFSRVSSKCGLAEQLKKLLEGNKFMEFVAEEYLQTIALHASGRLLSLTNGQYFLRYEGGFFVGDNLNGGMLRPVYTLSGGETFLVSLSLALALGAELCAKSLRPIEFFFLDEGFGTLDAHLVDTVMDSLEKLRSENLCIGIISHVEELKHRIDRKLLARKATEQRGSLITAE